MNSGTPNELLKERLVTFVQDMYSMENMLYKPIERYTEEFKRSKKFPEFQAKMYEYMDWNKKHITHLVDRLEYYKVHPTVADKWPPNSYLTDPTFKPETFASMSLLQFVTNFYAITSYKIGLYRMLTTMAHAYGDKDLVRTAEFNLRENMEMQRWIFEHMPEVCLYTMEIQNIPFAPMAWDFAKQLELAGVTTPYTPTPPPPTRR